ncbi:MAG: DHH family phosphoesterase [Clostridia bacterium]|nr:DHH family phosphoesterase [Clostridia bacterium]
MSDKNTKGRRDDIFDGNNKKRSNLPKLSPRLVLTVAIAAICIIFSLSVLIAQGMEGSAGNAAEYLQLSSFVSFVLLTVIIVINIILHFREAEAQSLKEKILIPHQHFPIGILNKLSQPAAIFDPSGRIVWGNASFCRLAPKNTIIAPELHGFYTLFKPEYFDAAPHGEAQHPDITGLTVEELLGYAADNNAPIACMGIPEKIKYWTLHAYRHVSDQNMYFLIVMTDTTELHAKLRELEDSRPMCAYVVIDNLEELVSREQESYRRASADVDRIIKGWASELNAVIKEYERDKYIMIFSHDRMSRIITDKQNHKGFDILENVREITVGKENIPVTVSIGVSRPDGTLLDKERSAQLALDTALRRGGNQAIVYEDERSFTSYGGKERNTLQTHSSVQTRVFGERLCSVINSDEVENVIIMGHRNPDFDALGACVGIARLAMSFKKEVKLIVDEKESSISDAIELLHTLPEYDLLFMDYMNGLDKLPDHSILVCCDVNSYNQFQSPDMVKEAETLFIIDHHRTGDQTPVLSPEMEADKHYDFMIVPSASSASELVTEILEHNLPDGAALSPVEANIMFAGLLLDTRQFTRNAQAATFSAALYLRNNGADPARAQAMFKTELTDYQLESGFGTNVIIERGFIAIAKETGENSSTTKRIAAAKTADRLLNIKGIRASFAVARMGADVFVSARSDGTVNVQLIMEGLGGGGHYNAAAAMLRNTTAEKAIQSLQAEINKYFRVLSAPGDSKKRANKRFLRLRFKRVE